MSFNIKDLPYAQFEQLGMSKRDVITMPVQELADMLNGHRSGLMTLKIDLGQGMQPFHTQAKLSLMRNPDNSLSLGVHPILPKPVNTIEASPEQWEKMLKGEPIVKESRALNGTIEPHVHQLDKDTNEILSARLERVLIPKTIKETTLSPDHIEKLKKGEEVEIKGKDSKEAIVVRLDLNEAKGFKIITREQTRELLQAPMPVMEVEDAKVTIAKGPKR
jgi:hypothetical protein